MTESAVLDEVLDAARQLDRESQLELIARLSRRLAFEERVLVAWEEARVELAAGRLKPMTATEIVREATS